MGHYIVEMLLYYLEDLTKGKLILKRSFNKSSEFFEENVLSTHLLFGQNTHLSLKAQLQTKANP